MKKEETKELDKDLEKLEKTLDSLEQKVKKLVKRNGFSKGLKEKTKLELR